jgi:hypothetical protein
MEHKPALVLPLPVLCEISGSDSVGMKMAIIWDVAPCSLVDIDLCFGGAYCLHHQGSDSGGSELLWNMSVSTRLHGAKFQKAAIFSTCSVLTLVIWVQPLAWAYHLNTCIIGRELFSLLTWCDNSVTSSHSLLLSGFDADHSRRCRNITPVTLFVVMLLASCRRAVL